MSFLTLLSSGIRLTLPLLLAGMGVMLCARSGIVNMSLEGTMLFGAFTSVWAALTTGNPMLGQIAGATAGVLYSLILGFFIIYCRGNHAVCGLGMNFVAQGITTVLLGTMFGGGSTPTTMPLPSVTLPLIGKQSVNFFLTILIVMILYILVYHTNFGLRLRAVGESPSTADALGVSVAKYRFIAMVLCGALGGFAGSELALGQIGCFTKLMTASKGFLAYSAVIFGGYGVIGTMISTFVLGMLDALQMRLQLLANIPGQLLLMLPYLFTLIAMIFVGNVHKPAALGKPYERGRF